MFEFDLLNIVHWLIAIQMAIIEDMVSNSNLNRFRQFCVKHTRVNKYIRTVQIDLFQFFEWVWHICVQLAHVLILSNQTKRGLSLLLQFVLMMFVFCSIIINPTTTKKRFNDIDELGVHIDHRAIQKWKHKIRSNSIVNLMSLVHIKLTKIWENLSSCSKPNDSTLGNS